MGTVIKNINCVVQIGYTTSKIFVCFIYLVLRGVLEYTIALVVLSKFLVILLASTLHILKLLDENRQ